ncbi:MAG TPA: radical SAM protein [bacterium]|nr:radical SAM protein [bacterium]
MPRLLLINPKFPESFWSFTWVLDNVAKDKKAVNSPLGLATLAALTPADWDIALIDENVEPIDWDFEADVVGVCGMGVQVPRQKEILEHFKKRGIFVVAGGSYASLCPEDYEGLADAVIAGESEYIWPKFCADFAAGSPRALYQETGEVDLTDSPAPRYDLLNTDLYQKVSLQFSRGCPFRCEFCDIIVMFGRKPRTKSLEQVERELDMLRSRGVTSVFFVDDNLIGHIHKAKELLAFLADYQKRHDYRFSFGTEASINMTGDAELMSLFQKANFEWVFIGIETPNEESLKETLKNQNLRSDLLTSIRTVYAHGIDIFAGFIVGFDHDDKTIFERQYHFIVNSGIVVSMVALLCALPKTPLFERLHKAGRLRQEAAPDNTRPFTNVIPLQMSQEELIVGYEDLQRRLTDDRAIYERIRNKLKHLKHPLTSPHLSFRQKFSYASGLMLHGILPGGPRRIAYFLRSCLSAARNPKTLAVIITDWIAALSLKSYRVRHFDKTATRVETARLKLQAFLLRARDGLEGVSLKIAAWDGIDRLRVELKGAMEMKKVLNLSKALRKTLRKTHEEVVIDLRAFKESGAEQTRLLLKHLRRYRRQVYIEIPEALYRALRSELSRFQYTLVSRTV